jgi:tripartite-type tricarboxylate transporter receptor subunit TctC
MITRRLVLASLLAGAPLLLTGVLRARAAEAYPARPIKMIAPFTPGSPVDVVARLLAQHLSIQLKQSVVVENRPGAGTTIGMKAAALAEADGYTLLFQSSSLVVAPAMYKNLDYDPLKSFAPVANVAWGTWVTVVPPSLPVRSPQELIAHAKAHPNTLNFGFGQGTAPQLVGEWFNKTNGLAIASVPYKGGMQAITDMLGGTIHVNIGTSSTLLPLIREGKIRAIAQWGKSREADLPDVPTMIESGFPGLSLGFWVGLWAPAATPAAIVEQLNAAANAALGSPEMLASMQRLGIAPSIGTVKDFADFIADETPRWAEIVRVSGTQIE